MKIKRHRAKRGLLICWNEGSNGKSDLSIDDIKQSEFSSQKWDLDVFFTSKQYDKDTLKNLDFSEKELADFGYTIIARLYAFHKHKDMG